MKFIDDYKKETKELRSRLLDVSNTSRVGIQSKLTVQSNDISGNDSRGDQRKGAAPISC